MKIGCTILMDYFCGEPESPDTIAICEAFGGKEGLIDFLQKNIDAIEVNGVSTGITSPESVMEAVVFCKNHGLYATIHGSLSNVREASDFFEPYTFLFQSGLQEIYNVTIHPLKSKTETETLLRSICKYADEKNYPIQLMLENQRYQNQEYKERNCESVTEIVRNIDSDYLKICFDFGHQLWGTMTYGEQVDPVSEQFLSLVRHTHIHGIFEGHTHYDISQGDVMLDKNVGSLLRNGYDGVLNLEICTDQFKDRFDVRESLEDSISRLKVFM